MHLKVAFVVFLCVFSACIIYTGTMVAWNAAEGLSFQAISNKLNDGYLITDGIEPNGDPIEGGGWPK